MESKEFTTFLLYKGESNLILYM